MNPFEDNRKKPYFLFLTTHKESRVTLLIETSRSPDEAGACRIE